MRTTSGGSGLVPVVVSRCVRATSYHSSGKARRRKGQSSGHVVGNHERICLFPVDKEELPQCSRSQECIFQFPRRAFIVFGLVDKVSRSELQVFGSVEGGTASEIRSRRLLHPSKSSHSMLATTRSTAFAASAFSAPLIGWAIEGLASACMRRPTIFARPASFHHLGFAMMRSRSIC